MNTNTDRHRRLNRASPASELDGLFDALAVAGSCCVVASPVLFVLVWFGLEYLISVMALFLGFGLSMVSLMGFKRLGSRCRVLAVVGLSVSVLIFPCFLLVDYEFGRHDFSCSGSLFWSCD